MIITLTKLVLRRYCGNSMKNSNDAVIEIVHGELRLIAIP
jgi:hypothetical protein